MRWLLFISFTCCFLSPAESHVSEAGFLSYKKDNKSDHPAQVTTYITDQCSDAIARSTANGLLTVRSAIFPNADFVQRLYVLTVPTFISNSKTVSYPFFDFKEIGRRLIFPQHYFW